jgi:hypothetical protein
VTNRRLTIALAVLVVVAFCLAAPAAMRANLERGNFYIFASTFFTDLPRRLAGPGRFRFVLQPTIATALGIRDGIADRRAGRGPFLRELILGEDRWALLSSGIAVTRNLVLMGILLDTICQWLILGVAYPAAALVVGPVLIASPYAVARALANRAARALGS